MKIKTKQQTKTEEFKKKVYEINPKIIIIGEYKSLSAKIKLKCFVCGKEFDSNPSNIIYGHASGMCRSCSYKERNQINSVTVCKGNTNQQKKKEETCSRIESLTSAYKAKISDLGIKVELIGDYTSMRVKTMHRCLKCGAEFMMTPRSVIENFKSEYVICKYCGYGRKEKEIHCLWENYPEYAKMLANPKDGYRITRSSYERVDWACPTCGTLIKGKTVPNVVQYGLTCPLCSIGKRSYGHRLLNVILEYCGIEYANEVGFNWSGKKRYDIYVNDNCIIEVNGKQHYEMCNLHTFRGLTLDDEISNDNYKREIALKNGIEYYIEVNASKSEFQFIINKLSANKSFVDYINKFSNIEFKNIDWQTVYKMFNEPLSLKFMEMYNSGVSLKDIQKELHLSEYKAKRILHDLANIGLCKYKNKYGAKPVICITTNEYFETLAAAGKGYGINPKYLSAICSNHSTHKYNTGTLSDGTKLQWRYATQEEIDEQSRKIYS